MGSVSWPTSPTSGLPRGIQIASVEQSGAGLEGLIGLIQQGSSSVVGVAVLPE